MTTPNDPFGEQPQATPVPPPPPEYGTGYGTGYGVPGQVEPGFGGMASIPAPPGQWAGPPLAEWPQRAIASLIDGVIVLVPYYILLSMEATLLALGVSTGLNVYFQYLHSQNGQTPGKKVMKIRLLREADGRPMGFASAIGRSILHIVDVLPCGVGFLWPIWDDKKQTFADKIMATVVIQDRGL
jgi:uncharacterized RDD family membrane protein YckC